MTVCYTLPDPLGTYTIGYDRTAPWDAQWVISFTRPVTDRPVALRRCFTYTEARTALARIVPGRTT
jgi:hypothetical protein